MFYSRYQLYYKVCVFASISDFECLVLGQNFDLLRNYYLNDVFKDVLCSLLPVYGV